MKNNLITAILFAAALLCSSCRRELSPAFSFENYEQEFDSKQPFSVRMSYIRMVNADKSPILRAIEESWPRRGSARQTIATTTVCRRAIINS